MGYTFDYNEDTTIYNIFELTENVNSIIYENTEIGTIKISEEVLGNVSTVINESPASVTINAIDFGNYTFKNIDNNYAPFDDSAKDGVFIITSPEGKKGLIDTYGKVVIEPKYNYILNASANMLLVRENEHSDSDSEISFEYVSYAGEKLFSKINDESIFIAEPFVDGYAVSMTIGDQGSMYSVIDTEGNVIFEPAYYQYNNLGGGFFVRVSNENGIYPDAIYEIVNSDGDVLFSHEGSIVTSSAITGEGFDVDDIIVFANLKKEFDNSGIMNLNGDIILNPEYNLIDISEENYIFIDSNSDIVTVNKNGEIITTFSSEYSIDNFRKLSGDIVIFKETPHNFKS